MTKIHARSSRVVPFRRCSSRVSDVPERLSPPTLQPIPASVDSLVPLSYDFCPRPHRYSDKLGFLGTCPSNLGTGLRASVMIRLPAFNETEESRVVLDQVTLVSWNHGAHSKALECTLFTPQDLVN